jgi:ABC-2 type transport system ATP-binding protein
VLELGTPEARRAAASEILTRLTGEAPAVDAARGLLRVPARDGARTVVDAIVALDDAGIPPTSVALHKPTLDDVFLALTGGQR